MSGQPPLLDVEDGVARITLRRPRQANRLTVDDLATLRGFIEAVNANAAVRVLVLARVCQLLTHFPISSAANPHGCWVLLGKLNVVP